MSDKAKRGFALLSKEEIQRIGRLGGKRAHALGKAHRFTEAEAALAGRKGGLASAKKKQDENR
jgi:general stress protein YciG